MFMQIQVKLLPSELQEMIKEKIQKEMPDFKVKSVTFDGSQQYDTRGEHYGYYFSGVTVELEKK